MATNNEVFQSLIEAIIKHQELIIGPLAWSEAKSVVGLETKGDKVFVSGDGKAVLEKLVGKYEALFGQASVEACKDAVRPLLSSSKTDLPEILK